MRTRPYGKIVWSKKHEDFVRKNHPIMTNRQLADKLPYGLTTVRQKCYELGLYRMRLEYWTPEQERFLEQNDGTPESTYGKLRKLHSILEASE